MAKVRENVHRCKTCGKIIEKKYNFCCQVCSEDYYLDNPQELHNSNSDTLTE